MARYGVIILNWNSHRDTMECLDSVLGGTNEALPIVVDNGSTDGSVPALLAWCRDRHLQILALSGDGCSHNEVRPTHPDLVLVQNPENLGFAKGSNAGLRCAVHLGLDEVVFLNNDTVAAPGALSLLVSTLRNEPALFATLPLIRVHRTSRVWNCGGRISPLGFRRYHFAGADLAAVHLPDRVGCTFFTGCCFAVRTAEFASRGGFTERFFFGEEDFELGLWMLQERKRAVCLTAALIDHKVSATASRIGDGPARRVYAHYLNRFIHMRLRLGTLAWAAWVALYIPYLGQLLMRNSVVTTAELPRFVQALVHDARRHDGVTRELFMQLMRANRW